MKNNLFIYAGVGIALYFLLKNKKDKTAIPQQVKSTIPSMSTMSPEVKTAPAPIRYKDIPEAQKYIVKPAVPVVNYAIPVSQEYNVMTNVDPINLKEADKIVTNAVNNLTFTAAPTMEVYSRDQAKKEIQYC